MKFFSKIVFICNTCFLLTILLRYWENAHKTKAHFDGAIPLQPLQSTLVILGYGAIILNLIFNVLLVVLFVTKIKQQVPKWIIWINFLLLLLQVYYFDLLFIS